MPSIDFKAVDTPVFSRPELLRHGTIPQPLFGVAPRNIMGEVWWDLTRREAYSRNNMRCYACGGPGPLNAHEVYDIDYARRTSTYIEAVALCNKCHDFIHIGRLVSLFSREKVSIREFKATVLHGYNTLRVAGLKCHWSTTAIRTATTYMKADKGWVDQILRNCDPPPKVVMEHNAKLEWDDWRMIFEGKKYKPKYVNSADATQHYLMEE